MATNSINSFKKYARGMRVMATEQVFNQGMYYTDNPIATGQSRLLVNMNLADQGRRIRPRGGLETSWLMSVLSSADRQFVHHVGASFVESGTDAVYRRYVLLGHKNVANNGMLFSDMVLMIENPETESFVKSVLTGYTGADVLRYDNNTDWNTLHNVAINDPYPIGLNASIEGNTYMLTNTGMVRLKISLVGGVYQHTLEQVEPRVITAAQAVNYGYNMLLASPYNFPNVQGVTLRLDGILPYDAANNLKLNAKVGEQVRFRLSYMYPAGAPTYKVQWEVQDLKNSTTAVVVQKAASSPTYTAGDDIVLDYNIVFKQFSLIAKVYASTDLTEPLKVIQLASYYTSDDNTGRNLNLEPKTYSLNTSKNMCSWNGRLVVWGVANANMTIFFSDTNDPTYFPFPQNAQPYDEEILNAVPFMDALLVFTETKIHMLSYDMVNGFTTKVIQDSLRFQRHDANTVVVVKNMVFFKSAAYYYMIVPKVNVVSGTELQLAPVSKPIEFLLDNFEQAIAQTIYDVYTLDFLLKAPAQTILITLQSFHNFLDNAQINNVYKYKITHNGGVLYLDVVLCYDTLLRAWTLKMYECNEGIMLPYRRVATDSIRYVNLCKDGTTVYMQLIKANKDVATDTFALDNMKLRTIKNYQLMDTGKRDILGTLKKRFREVIIEFNNVSDKDLEFNDIFIIDDEHRSDLFKYNVVHITDPLDPNYGTIYVERDYVDPDLVSGTTVLDSWKLGVSGFPEQSIIKLALEVSGKGYYPRLRLISRNEAMYEINNIGWVYRELNAR